MMKMKEESEKVSLKLNIQITKIMASGPITSWQIDGETVETVSDLIFGGSKITADGDCSHEIKMYRTVLWTLWERERVGRFGRMALKHVKYHVCNELPVQVRCTILDAWG